MRIPADHHGRTLAEPYGPVSNEEAMVFGCPFCHVPEGAVCVTMSSYGRDRDYNRIEPGTPCQVAHWQRKVLVREARQRAFLRASRRDGRPVHPATRVQHEIRAALLDFDRREYIALRDWLAEHGHILWEAVA
jgi:hypothetical protein